MKTIGAFLLVTVWLLAVSGCKSSYGHRDAPHPYDRILSEAGIKYTIHGLRADGSFGIELYELGKEGLSPLRGLPLTFVNAFTVKPDFDDLSPLKGMQLYCLYLPSRCAVADLSPLSGMPLEMLSLQSSRVSDLSPLRGMKLKSLDINGCQVVNLLPLRDTSVENLSMDRTKVKDLSPLKVIPGLRFLFLGCPLWYSATPMIDTDVPGNSGPDLSPLKDVPLESLTFPADTWTNSVDKLRDHKALKSINGMEPTDFWKAYDEGRFKMTR